MPDNPQSFYEFYHPRKRRGYKSPEESPGYSQSQRVQDESIKLAHRIIEPILTRMVPQMVEQILIRVGSHSLGAQTKPKSIPVRRREMTRD